MDCWYRPLESRIPPADSVPPLPAGSGMRPNMPWDRITNFTRIRAHNPPLHFALARVVDVLFTESMIPARVRELLALRVGWNCQSAYEFAQHSIIATACGVTQGEIRAIGDPSDLAAWSEGDRALLVASDEMCRCYCISDETWDVLRRHYNDGQLVEIVFVIGIYQAMSGFLNATGVKLEEGQDGRLPAPRGAGVGPSSSASGD